MGMKYQDIITIDPGKRGGKPCIHGMRITVYYVMSYRDVISCSGYEPQGNVEGLSILDGRGYSGLPCLYAR